MNHASVPDPDDPQPDKVEGESVVPREPQYPPPEHLARHARLVEQGLPQALRGDRSGFD